MKWHYQVLRHDLWDRDNPSPPTLVQLERDGQVVDAVALTTKSGHLFVFDRETGESMYPIHEVDTALPSTMPGEVPAPKQPVSSVAFSRQVFEVTDRTEEARQAVLEKIKDYDLRPWAPPRVGTILIHPWYDGGAEWGGSAFDPANNRLILNANDVAGALTLNEIPVGFSKAGSYAQHCGSCHGPDFTGTDAGPTLVGAVDRLGYAEVLKVTNEGKGRMPAFAHLDDVERNGILDHIVAPEPVIDEPTTEGNLYALLLRLSARPRRPAGQHAAMGNAEFHRHGDRRNRLAGTVRATIRPIRISASALSATAVRWSPSPA